MAKPLVKIAGLQKEMGHFTLGPVQFQIEPGSIVAVVGPNGAGKSSLFKLLLHLLHPDQGEISLFGLHYPEHEVVIKQRIGYVPQDMSGCEGMKVQDIVKWTKRWYPRWQAAEVEHWLNTFEIAPQMIYKNLSKGLQRKFAFALALGVNGDLLLLDEPSAGVDMFSLPAVYEGLVRYMEAGQRSILLATHQPQEVKQLADYIFLMSRGKQIGVYEKDRLLTSYKAVWISQGQPLPAELPAVHKVEQQGGLCRLVTSDVEATRAFLDAQQCPIIRIESLELEEILALLIEGGSHHRDRMD
ncbi:ABC-2 type transport system ATP-binding protein [Caldalkalibacillus uzonensis]|uniref:ABC-2 type transport system ATP-binding protein n=1 Tax=Caldalkalibacillus uzonensis TaxID=353224 RepID=A0ABU0CYC6_9BACI|nr:ABC transporter ATP-binding protein [Caldalkalibacillus uzonensis]MDQ0341142.1 ABC-2 type transport system ATP-binding protein [Caldalkalibacillus uzonensis]